MATFDKAQGDPLAVVDPTTMKPVGFSAEASGGRRYAEAADEAARGVLGI